MTMTDLAWDSGSWLNPPEVVHVDGSDLLVTCRQGSDFWRTTSYGFVHDDGHGLLLPMADRAAVEVSFVLDFAEQFDQAGVLVRASATQWVKSGVEVSDGVTQVGAVVTREESDWSVAPVPSWVGSTVTVRASRDGDALTVRAHAGGPWQLVRVAPLDPALDWSAGPFACAPSRAGLQVRFTRFAIGPADEALHAD